VLPIAWLVLISNVARPTLFRSSDIFLRSGLGLLSAPVIRTASFRPFVILVM
jgi:hypothetical protein